METITLTKLLRLKLFCFLLHSALCQPQQFYYSDNARNRHHQEYLSNQQNSPLNGNNNNYWYEYWYKDGQPHSSILQRSNNDGGNSFDWRNEETRGNLQENWQNGNQKGKRDLLQISKDVIDTIKNGKVGDYFVNLFNGKNGEPKNNGNQQQNKKIDFSLDSLQENIKKLIKNRREFVRNNNNGNTQQTDEPNWKQSDFNNYNYEWQRGRNDYDYNFRPNFTPTTAKPPVFNFWIGAQPDGQPSNHNINRTRTINNSPNWFRPGLRRNNNGQGQRDSDEDVFEQNDLLIESQKACGQGGNLESYIETSIRIARGHQATEMYPWLVAIYQSAPGKDMQFICGGSLITSKHVVSAAHCFLARESNQYEFIISNNRILKSVEAPYTMRKAARIILHPSYNPQVTPANADVAVVVFERPVQFGTFIKPICLWRGDNNIRSISDEIGRIVGWGADEYLAIPDELPMEINTGILDYKTCIVRDNTFLNIVGENSFCTGYRNGSGPCMGDSGSGFMLKQDGRWTLRGVVSLTTRLVGCDIDHYVGLTDVAKYQSWIFTILRK